MTERVDVRPGGGPSGRMSRRPASGLTPRVRLPRGPSWAALPAAGFVLLVFIAPMTLLLPQSVEEGPSAFQALLIEPVYRGIIGNTARISAWTSVFCVLIGYPLALWISRLSARARIVAIIAVVLPFWVSVLVRTYAWMVILGREGLVNETLLRLGVTDEPIAFLFNDLGVLIGTVNMLVPFFILPMVAVMSAIDERLIAAALSLGASRTQAFWRVWFPLTVPGLLGGAFLIFILSFGFYVTPAVLGGGRVQMLATLLDTLINNNPNWSLAAALSVTLLVALLIGYGLARIPAVVGRQRGVPS